MDIDSYRNLSERERMEFGMAALSAVAATQSGLDTLFVPLTPVLELDASTLARALRLDQSQRKTLPPKRSRAGSRPDDSLPPTPAVITKLEQLQGQTVGVFALTTQTQPKAAAAIKSS
jgi:hypothetical protein